MKVVIPDTVREHRERKAAEEAAAIEELSEAFAPATIPGLAKRLWAINAEMGELKREQETLRQVLDGWCRRTGQVIEVEGQPPLRLVSEFEWDTGRMKPREVYKLRFDRKGARNGDQDGAD